MNQDLDTFFCNRKAELQTELAKLAMSKEDRDDAWIACYSRCRNIRMRRSKPSNRPILEVVWNELTPEVMSHITFDAGAEDHARCTKIGINLLIKAPLMRMSYGLPKTTEHSDKGYNLDVQL
jgi:hypothetical protein